MSIIITQLFIGYIPGHNCSKDKKELHPMRRWSSFLSGGLGGEAHEQVAPVEQPTRRENRSATTLRFYFFDALASQRYYLPISSNTQRTCRSTPTIMNSCVKSDSRSERKEDFGKGVTSTFRHGLT